MAKLSSDGKYVTVESGDTLSAIARDHAGGASNYKKLAAINNIPNPDLIYIGQKIYLTESGSSDSGTTTNNANSNAVTIDHFGLQSNNEKTLFATWSWSKHSQTASYRALWIYGTGDGVAFIGSDNTKTVDEVVPAASKQDTFTIPSQATVVKLKVKPISKTYKQGDKDVTYWTADWSTEKEYNVSDLPPTKPNTPTVEIKQYTLTATVDGAENLNATSIQSQIVKDDEKVYKTGTANIVTGHASYSCSVDAGSKYKVRCRSCRGDKYSEWTAYSGNEGTIPSIPTGITTIRGTSETSIYLEWASVASAESYDLEYTTEKRYFDGSDQVTAINDIKTTNYEKTGLTAGEEYFFRVRAKNTDGESGWSDVKSVVIGEKPAAPTTWSSTTTAITGETVNLYWVHNARDESSQTYAELELYIDGVLETHEIKNDRSEEDKDKTSSYSLSTSSFVEGTSIQWRVRTAGVTMEYGDWSIQRTVDVNAPPTLSFRVTDKDGNVLSTITSFPFYVYALGGPSTQVPIGYHLSIEANSSYETADSIGNVKMVNAGDSVYSKYFDISDELLVEMSAGNVDLENNVSYTVRCIVSMNSGLTAEESVTINVSWADVDYLPNAEIGIDQDTLTASIRPYCQDNTFGYYQVTQSGNTYTKSNTKLNGVFFESALADTFTTTGEPVYRGTTSSGSEVYYCEAISSTKITGVNLAVYRREFDGSFTELATGLDSSRDTTVTDPHPALDLARYRIVATSQSTGAVSYYDLPGHPVGCKSIVIQWNEAWSNFDAKSTDALESPPWAGSLLKLPYNIDVSDTNNSDVALIEYIGRAHPTTYYGTQLGQTATWSVAIRKDDEETLYGLRRLAKWLGDVYVREPSGSGYWATISVSFSQKHRELTIPVTLDITRVEGGV